MTFAFVKINFVIKLTNLFWSIFLYRKTSTSSNWTDDDNFSTLIKLPAQVGTLTKWKRKLVELKLVDNHFSSNQNSPTTIFARIKTHWELFVNIDLFRIKSNKNQCCSSSPTLYYNKLVWTTSYQKYSTNQY